MPTTERLYEFDLMPTLDAADIIYCADVSDSDKEVKTTVAGLIGAYPALLSLGGIALANSMIFITDSSGVAQLSSTLPAFTMGGIISADNNTITGLPTPTASTDAANKAYVDASGSGTVSSVTGTTNEIDVGGTASDPVLSLSATIDTPGTFNIQSTTAVGGINNDNTLATASATTLSTDLALKTYIDNVAGSGFTVVLTCLLGTTANLSGTYANGTAGVGATLTNNTTQAALEVDGVTVQVADRLLVKNQTATTDNGVYVVTTVGDGSTNWVLTRATDYDEPSEIIPGTLVPISSGTVNGGSIYLESATVTTIGTDPILFDIFAQPGNSFVTLATNQTVTGDKEFTGTTIVPTPSTDTEAANKGYVDAAITGGGGGGNVGDFVDFAGTSAPSGCLLCDGTSYATATYPDLFAVIGYTWGGSGANFNVPNAERRVMIGSGGTGTATIGNAVGDTGGAETVTLATTNMPGGVPINASTSGGINVVSNTGTASYVPKSGTPYSGGASTAVNITQKSMVVLRCIRYEPVATSTATASNQASQETATSSVVFTNPASQQYHPSSAKAWVVFNGTGTLAITASYNVTSVTDNGSGDYTVNFTNAFSSINYSASGSCADGTSITYTSGTAPYVCGPQATPTASAWRFGTGQGTVGAQSGVRADYTYISVQFFGELA